MKYILTLVASGDSTQAVATEAQIALARAVVDGRPRNAAAGHRGATAGVTWQILTNTDDGDDTTDLRPIG